LLPPHAHAPPPGRLSGLKTLAVTASVKPAFLNRLLAVAVMLLIRRIAADLVLAATLTIASTHPLPPCALITGNVFDQQLPPNALMWTIPGSSICSNGGWRLLRLRRSRRQPSPLVHATASMPPLEPRLSFIRSAAPTRLLDLRSSINSKQRLLRLGGHGIVITSLDTPATSSPCAPLRTTAAQHSDSAAPTPADLNSARQQRSDSCGWAVTTSAITSLSVHTRRLICP
jgi:hypothetical protein